MNEELAAIAEGAEYAEKGATAWINEAFERERDRRIRSLRRDMMPWRDDDSYL